MTALPSESTAPESKVVRRRDSTPDPDRHTPKPGRLFSNALRLRCPLCASNGVVRRWFWFERECRSCGLPTSREEGAFVGSIGVNTILSFGTLVFIVGGGLIASAPDFNVPLLTGISAVAAVLLPVFWLPFSRTGWLAADLAVLPLRVGEAPGFPVGDRG